MSQEISLNNNPIVNLSYGGIPTGGGYKAHTEYEIGAQRMSEAAHCILGSLGRGNKVRSPDGILAVERGHINEELGIIEHVIEEYSRELYTGRVWVNSNYKQDSWDSLKANSIKLAERAAKLKGQLGDSLDPRIQSIAEACYDMLTILGNSILANLGSNPESIENVYNDPRLRAVVKRLRSEIEDAYSSVDESLLAEAILLEGKLKVMEPSAFLRVVNATRKEMEYTLDNIFLAAGHMGAPIEHGADPVLLAVDTANGYRIVGGVVIFLRGNEIEAHVAINPDYQGMELIGIALMTRAVKLYKEAKGRNNRLRFSTMVKGDRMKNLVTRKFGFKSEGPISIPQLGSGSFYRVTD